MRKYFRIWQHMAVMAFKIQASHPLSSTGYLLGKMARIAFFVLFLTAIFRHIPTLAGYSWEEAMLFFLTFNLIDILAQLFFRGIYGIRSLIREGDFDYFLIQPTNVLYRCALYSVDFLDLVTVVPVVYLTYRVMSATPGGINAAHVGLYLALLINGLLIALAIHVIVAGLAVLTQEMENTIWIYRDLMTLGRFPVDIYKPAIQSVLIFLVPVAVMISFPAKAFLGRLDAVWIGQAFGISAAALAASFGFWRFSVRRYTSASS